MDIGATQSCEGHLDWGTRTPWVEVGAQDAGEMEDRMFELFQKGHQQEANHVAPDDVDKLYNEAHQLRREVARKNLIPARKVMQHLSEFYQTRADVPFDRRLTLQSVGTRSRLESQGAMFQETATPEERQQKLGEYQEEMKAFTGFLKNKHFGNPAPIPVAQTPKASITV